MRKIDRRLELKIFVVRHHKDNLTQGGMDFLERRFAISSGLSSKRIILSPFTKEFRGEGHSYESLIFSAAPVGAVILKLPLKARLVHASNFDQLLADQNRSWHVSVKFFGIRSQYRPPTEVNVQIKRFYYYFGQSNDIV